MSAYAAMFGDETEAPSTNDNLISPKKSSMSGANPQLQPQEDDLDEIMRGSVIRNKQKATTTQSPNYLKQFGRSAASLGDVAVGGIMPVVGQVVQPLVRPFTTPQKAEQIGQAIGGETQPIGKFFGVTDTPEYKQELSRQLLGYIGEHAEKGNQWLAEKTGLPIEDVRNITANLQLGIAPKLATPIKEGITTVAKPFEAAFQAAKQRAPSNLKFETVRPTTPQESLVGVGAAKTEPNPYKFSGEEGNKEYPTIKYSKIAEDVPSNEQQKRAEIASDVLGSNEQVRPGVVTGNENTLKNEYLLAKTPNPVPGSAADIMKRQIVNEQNALSEYAQERVRNTNADPRLINDYQRGERIHNFASGEEGLSGFFKKEKQKLYDDVKNKVGDNPIQSTNIDNLLNNKQFKAGMGLKGNEGVLKSVNEYIDLAKKEGFEDEHGNVYQPNTVNAWVAVQKALNKDWTKDNASVIAKINNAIEKDIGNAGGLEYLKKADSLHQAEKTLFGAKGIKTLFGDIDPNGIQTGTPFEKIPQKLNDMPVDEWKHIYDLSDKVASGKLFGPIDPKTGLHKWVLEVPPELRQMGQNAKNEIAGSIAREVHNTGSKNLSVWARKNVTDVLNARGEKIRHAFPLSEQQAFHKLNYAGHLMPAAQEYEGAALQAERLGPISSNYPLIFGKVAEKTQIPFAKGFGEKFGEKLQKGAMKKETQKQAENVKKQLQEAGKKSKLSDLGKE